MPTARIALVATALAVAPTSFGCAKKTAPPVVVVDDQPPGAGGEVAPGKPTGAPPGAPIHVRASVHNAADMMALVKQVTASWTPRQPIDPAAQIQAILLQMGYGPGLWSSLDLSGPFALDALYYSHDPSHDPRLVGSLPALSAKGVMDGLPSAQKPQPLGNGLWEFIQGDLRVVLREQPKALEFALQPDDLDRAAALASEASQGRRLRLRGSDLPPGMLQTSALDFLPAGLRRQVAAVLGDASAGSFELDAGTDRDLVLQLAAEAPFSRLGLSPFGPARAQGTALEGLLPANPVLVVAMPWGTPEVLHKALDKTVPIDQIPAPFDAVARNAVSAAHGVLDQLKDDVVLVLYLSPKGEATAVLAAKVKDEASGRAAIRAVEQVMTEGFTALDELTGDDKAAKIGFTARPDGVKAGPIKADLLTIPIPKNMAKEAEDMAPFLVNKKKLEAATFVSGDVAVFTLGAQATAFAGDIATGLKAARKASLQTDIGLGLARAASQGCHICVSVDPPAVLRLTTRVSAETSADKARIKKIDSAAATFARNGGAVGIGVKLEPNLGSLAIGVPKSVLILSPADAAQLGALWDSGEPAPAADKPLSGQ